MKPWQPNGICEECGKQLFERDRDYSVMLFDRPLCNKHIPDHDTRGNPTKVLKK